VQIWPIRDSADATVVGPPRTVFSGSTGRGALSRDGTVFCAEYGDAVVHVSLVGGEHRLIGKKRTATQVSISPDNRWVACAAWRREGAVVWELANPSESIEFRGRSPKVEFSPDGRWLVVSTGREYTQYRVGSWEKVRSYPRESVGDIAGPIGFSADGQTLALTVTRAVARFVSPDSGEEFARFETRSNARLAHFAFSPASDRFVETVESREVRLWDLSRIRAQLREHDLDWNPGEPLAERDDATSRDPWTVDGERWTVDGGKGPGLAIRLRLKQQKALLDWAISQAR